MKQSLHKAINHFLPGEHHIPKHSVSRIIAGVVGGVGVLSLFGSMMGYNVEAAYLPEKADTTISQPAVVVKKKTANTDTALNTKKVAVKKFNKAPKANAGKAQTILLPTTSTTLDGSASKDADGTIAVYSWRQVSGPNSVIIGTIKEKVVTITGLIKGSYTFELKVTDDKGRTAKAQVRVIVKDPNEKETSKNTTNQKEILQGSAPVKNTSSNKLPKANAGVDQKIKAATRAKLQAFDSTDDDGYIVLVNWKQVSGPTKATISAIETNMEVTTSPLSAGTYVFELSVEDDKGDIATDRITVTVTE